MFLLQFKKIARWSVFRAFLLGTMGITVLLFPDFLESSIIYAAAGYLILNGILGIVDFCLGNGREDRKVAYFNLLVTVAVIIVGILSIVYYRYLISMVPVFLGGLLMMEGIVYFITALCTRSKWKAILLIMALVVGSGGVALVIFTFGFGGLQTLAKLFGGLLLLSCQTELLFGLVYKNAGKNGGTV